MRRFFARRTGLAVSLLLLPLPGIVRQHNPKLPTSTAPSQGHAARGRCAGGGQGPPAGLGCRMPVWEEGGWCLILAQGPPEALPHPRGRVCY